VAPVLECFREEEEGTVRVRIKQLVESYLRVQEFLATYPPPQPAAAYAGNRKAFDDVVGRLATLAADDAAGVQQSRGETLRHGAARRALRQDHLEPIARAAKALAFDNPGLDRALLMPREQLPSVKLIAWAKAMRDNAAPFAPQFIGTGRPQDFLAQLDAAIEALRLAIVRRGATKGKHVGAKAGAALELKKGRRLVSLLDAQVRTSFRGNPEVLARWRTAKRVQFSTGWGGTRAPATEPDATQVA